MTITTTQETTMTSIYERPMVSRKNLSAAGRTRIAAELLRDVPSEARADHAAIAEAILRGDSLQQIIEMPETDRWPMTHTWLVDFWDEY